MPGYFAVICRIASIVSMASRRVSSWPVAIGNVRQSTMMSLDAHAPLADERVDEARGDAHLALGGAGLAVLVDRQRDDGGAVLLHERHDAAEAAGRAVAVLVVHGVDDRASADELETGLRCTAGSVESMTSGSVEALARRDTTSRMSATPSRPT